MLWLRNLSLLVCTLLLISCGFTPVYKQGAQRENLSAVEIITPQTKEGQWLRTALEDVLFPQGQTQVRYRLNPNFSITSEQLSIETDGTTRRYRLLGTANIALIDIASGKVIYTSPVHRFSSYHISQGNYSTYIAQQDATHQLIKAIAEEIRLRIISYFAINYGSTT